LKSGAGVWAVTLATASFAQDLAPRAYMITQVGASAITLADSFSTGSVFVDPSVLVKNAKAHFQTQTVSCYYSFALWGRSSNITILVPYVFGNVRAEVIGQNQQAYRSGLADSRVRWAVNLKGGPAISPRDFPSWQEKNLIGFSITGILPTGQFDPGRVVNIGSNRLAVKPEIGVSRRRVHWAIEGYAGAWFFAPNSTYFPGTSNRTQEPVGAGEAHLSYHFKPRFWISLDGNFWVGGQASLNGRHQSDEQRNSRAGFTVAIPATQHQSVKFSYATGAYVSIGGNYTTLSFAWQYSWIAGPE
jgi:hypothetical protein